MFEQFFPALRRRGDLRKQEDSPWDLFDQMVRSPFPWQEGGGPVPAVEVTEDKNNVLIKAELPGMDPEDVNVSIDRNTLIIHGEKKQEKSEERENTHVREMRYGSFSRTIPLPAHIREEGIKAKFKKGVLKITLPKSEEAKTKRIQIT